MKFAHTMIKFGLAVSLAALQLVGAVAWAAGIRVDHGLFTKLPKQHVADGVVDYRGFKTNEDALDGYLD